MTSDYHRALEAAVQEYEELGRQRREIDQRLAQLAQTIGTLNRLCGFVSSVHWGLTDACRVVLRGSGHPMTPVEVRDRLEAIGFDLSKYTNGLAAIHTVLKRLRAAREIEFLELDAGGFAYAWRRPPKSLALNESDLEGLESDTSPPARRKKKRRKA